MAKRIWLWGVVVLLGAALVSGIYINKKGAQTENPATAGNVDSGKRSIAYLGKAYAVPVKVERIVVTGALEALEDLLVLGVKPVGVMTIGGSFPAMFADITQQAKPVGERVQPNFEAILQIKPDIILSSDKFVATTADKLQKIAPTIPLSHFSNDGEASLRFIGELTGQQGKAEAVIQKYRQDAAVAKNRLPETVKEKKVIAVRLRSGNICIYPADLFFNDILYSKLDLPVPEEIKKAKPQEILSLEKLSEMDPDYIFVQYAESESPAHPRVMESLRQNPIWQNVKAVKNNHVFVNVVDPLIQGVAIGGKIAFLHAAVERLSQ
ncbi:Iron-uptake system-binding protein [Propionispora sp. 2/2-37]|uniref:ABC transporter substrate-binding protein n=1 Tax=Propionispora sp. 2/2-37 TaxID=1677858 RepID=UPI0006BB73D5|nr:ABC transporter substrate-binding protein [Propionispora sp. 2/2-37]CUH94740.1 Iron-uptake system-binding protein [Propionispora sp. 2/2-37]